MPHTEYKCEGKQLYDLVNACSDAREWLRGYSRHISDNPREGEYLVNYLGTHHDIVDRLITALSGVEDLKKGNPDHAL